MQRSLWKHCGWLTVAKLILKRFARAYENEPLLEEVEYVNLNPTCVRCPGGREVSVDLRQFFNQGSAETDRIWLGRNLQPQFYAVAATYTLLGSLHRDPLATHTFAESSVTAKRLKNTNLRDLAPCPGDVALRQHPPPEPLNVNEENVESDSAFRLNLDMRDTNDQQNDSPVIENDLSPTEPDIIPRRSAKCTKGQRWPWIRSAGVDTGRILRFPVRSEVNILWKTGPGVTFQFRRQELRGQFK